MKRLILTVVYRWRLMQAWHAASDYTTARRFAWDADAEAKRAAELARHLHDRKHKAEEAASLAGEAIYRHDRRRAFGL